MTPESHPGASVLIIDPDAAIRGMVVTVLKRAGFRTASVGDLDAAAALLERSNFAVIVRDLNLTPAQSLRTWQRLAATAPEVLRRTVATTTMPARATAGVRAEAVFAMVRKPFDIDELVNAVRACAYRSLEADRRASRRVPASRRAGRKRA